MRKKFIYIPTILASALFATGANAAQFVTTSGASGTFGDDAVTCTTSALPCEFTRTFNIVAPAGFNIANISIESISSSAQTNLDFTSVQLNGVDFNILSTGQQEFRNLLNQSVVSGAINRLVVTGRSGGDGSIAGNFSFGAMAAVPEPSTWMLMLLGMAGVGFSMRRKEKQTLRVRYT